MPPKVHKKNADHSAFLFVFNCDRRRTAVNSSAPFGRAIESALAAASHGSHHPALSIGLTSAIHAVACIGCILFA